MNHRSSKALATRKMFLLNMILYVKERQISSFLFHSQVIGKASVAKMAKINASIEATLIVSSYLLLTSVTAKIHS